MSSLTEGLKRYHRSTRSAAYGYLISLPLLFLYEFLIYVSEPDPSHYVRIGADVWVRSLLSLIGSNTTALTFALALIIGIAIFFVDRKKHIHLKVTYFLGIIGESIIYALILGIIISRFTTVLVNAIPPPTQQMSIIQRFALSLGAGLYEELFFRVVLVAVFMWIFKLLSFKGWAQKFAAIVSAAMIFSLAHFTGNMGDPFTIYAFVFRFLFGLALNVIYITRGFGAAAWTHALYDTLLIFLI
ncbi:MAG TPA: CPBP family intramembrane glutamic endopeptidase [Balneolales bacterium]|nr:CPBP family intramembrane glutamic endopeptidase [Balneolales bacterium]